MYYVDEAEPTSKWPSAKWWVSTAVSTATLLVVMVGAAQDQGVDLPEWLVLIGAILGPILVYMKRETNPSASAREVIEAESSHVE